MCIGIIERKRKKREKQVETNKYSIKMSIKKHDKKITIQRNKVYCEHYNKYLLLLVTTESFTRSHTLISLSLEHVAKRLP